MNAGIVTSTVIGGILLIAILSLSLRVSQESNESTFNQVTKDRAGTINQLVTYDFKKVGYNVSSPAITTADSTHFVFNADLDNDGTSDQISWQWTTNPVSSTSNPNDYVLRRTVNGSTTNITSGVTDFNITYFDANRNQTTTVSDIRQIRVEVTLESPEPIEGDYMRSSWDRLYVPWNIQDH